MTNTRGASFGRTGPGRADTVYFHFYDVTGLDHIRLLGQRVLPQLS